MEKKVKEKKKEQVSDREIEQYRDIRTIFIWQQFGIRWWPGAPSYLSSMSNNTNWISITSVIYIFFSGWGNGFILDLGSRQLRRLCPNWAKGETSKVCCWFRWYPFWAWRQRQSLVSSRENKTSSCKRHVNFLFFWRCLPLGPSVNWVILSWATRIAHTL